MQRVNDELLSDLQDIDMDWIMDDENMYRMLDGFKRDSKTPDEYQQKIKLFLNKNANKFGYGGLGDEVFNEELEAVLDEKRKKKKKKKSGKKDACYHKVKSRYKVWPSAYASGALVKCRKVGAKNWGNSKKESLQIVIEDELTQYINELRCWDGHRRVKGKTPGEPGSCEKIKEVEADLEEKKKKKACKPSKGKRFAKRVNGKCRSFGQKGQAKGGGDRIRPGTKKGDAYCARSAKIKKCKNPPCANALSRKKWKCRGSKSMKE